MTHLTEDILVAVRDSESADPWVDDHLESCAECRARVDEVRARSEAIDALLRAQPGSPTPALAKVRVRWRLDTERARRPPLFPRALWRVAALLVFSAGAVYALPGVSLPQWLDLGGADAVEPSPQPPAAVPAAGGGDPPQEAVLVPVGSRLQVRVEGLEPGRQVELLWLEGSTAWVSAGEGSTYTVGAGSATVRSTVGPVRVGVPRSAPWFELLVNGRTVFEGEGLRTSGRMIFEAPEG